MDLTRGELGEFFLNLGEKEYRATQIIKWMHQRGEGDISKMTDLSKEEQRYKCEKLLNEFGLNSVRNNIGNLLSGGERRRTEIARSLATEPKFILLDEPFAGVDPIAVEDIQVIVKKLIDKNIGVLITDHNVHETLSITDRAYLLFEGSVLKQGSSEELASDEKVKKLYLGKNFELRK